MRRLSRRRFVVVAGKGSVMLAATQILMPVNRVVLPGAKSLGPGQTPPRQYRNLRAAEAATLFALAEIILPAPSGHPSVRDVDVVGYIDAEATRGDLDLLRSGLRSLDATAGVAGDPEGAWSRLEVSRRREHVSRMAAGSIRDPEWRAQTAQGFFELVRFHCVDAYYSNPAVFKAIGYGGSAQFVGYPDFHVLPQKHIGH